MTVIAQILERIMPSEKQAIHEAFLQEIEQQNVLREYERENFVETVESLQRYGASDLSLYLHNVSKGIILRYIGEEKADFDVCSVNNHIDDKDFFKAVMRFLEQEPAFNMEDVDPG